MKHFINKTILLFVLSIGMNNIFAQAQISSKVISNGGSAMQSANYGMTATVGQAAIGKSTSANYIANVGFWYLIDHNVTGIDDKESNDLPDEFKLEQNYPNPFNPSTTIKFSLKENAFTEIKIYDILGAEVASLISKNLTAGRYEVVFNANSLASGIYIYRITAGKFTDVKKMNLLK
ncbi:MAG: T9SS type A sorting domain-containing protein [Chlorobi bacterium]|nr:T9SS type A sorting domain-containing protein [Chlorobiota bacterium]